MRGKPKEFSSTTQNDRITPADAGKTQSLTKVKSFTKDHPRGCGENSEPAGKTIVNAGSPPRMRGKRNSRSVRCRSAGITPADAGKTRHTSRRDGSRQDHPRGCGENEGVYLFAPPKRGSPPRMRGKPYWCAVVDAAHRITPADAGKTRPRLSPWVSRQDHPRGCGENRGRGYTDSLPQGSPPRMRGKRFTQNWEALRNRITPADAGKTISLCEGYEIN